MTLPVTQIVQDQKVGKSLNNGLELGCMKRLWPDSWYYPGICLEGSRKTLVRIGIQTKI